MMAEQACRLLAIADAVRSGFLPRRSYVALAHKAAAPQSGPK